MTSSDTPTAVITSVHPFGAGLVVGAHQIARELTGRGWRVALLSDPASLVHLLGCIWHTSARQRVAAALRAPLTVDGLLALTPLTFVPLARDCGAGVKSFVRWWPWLSWPVVPRFLARYGFRDIDLFLLDGPLPACLQTSLRPRWTVLRLFDDTSEERRWPRALADQRNRLAKAADLVAITAPAIEQQAMAMGARRVHLMPNGADIEHFARPASEPADLAPIPRPRVVYVGALAPWVHFDLMDQVARRMPQVSFVWIGPGRPELIVRRHNVYVLGSRPYAELPGYLQHCDAGVIPFDRDRHPRLVDSVHPLKLYDYLAAGLPVVATPWVELRRIAAPVRFACSPHEFVDAIGSAFNDGRIDASPFLATATWAARVDGLLRALTTRP
ncbi:MAG: glycosyltransferase [Hyphomicrobiaceae bacterium]